MRYVRHLFFIQIFALCSVFGAPETEAPATEEKKTEQPQIEDLKQGWWNYFSASGPELGERITTFEASLDQLLDNVSEDNKKSANTLVARIKNNLTAYSQTINLPLPQIPPAPTMPASYSVDETLDVFRKLVRQQAELAATKVELKDKSDLLQSLQEKYRSSLAKYDGAESRSQQKLLLGLETVAYRTNAEVLQKHVTLIQKEMEAKQAQINHLQEELERSLKIIETSDLDLYTLAQKAKVKQKEWETAKAELKIKETAEQSLTSEAIADKKDFRVQLLLLESDQAEIKESIAENQYLLSAIELALSRLIKDPAAAHLEEVRKETENAAAVLESIAPKIKDWQTTAERQIESAGQVINQTDGKDKDEAADQKKIIVVAQENLLLVEKLRNELKETQFFLNQLKKQTTLAAGGSEKWLQQLWDWLVELANKAGKLLQKELFSIGETSITTITLLRFVIIIALTIWVAKITTRALSAIIQRRQGVKKSLVYTISRLINYLLLALGFIIALSTVGFDMSNLILIMSALGVGIGFGLQSIFNNFISGIIILFESNLKVGDYVELESGLRGEIREINVRSTLITDNDGIDVLVPNSEILSNKVLNWTLKMPYRRIHIPFTVAYGTDKELVRKILIEAAKKVPHTLDKIGFPEPRVRLTKLGDNGMEFDLVVWIKAEMTKKYRATQSDYLWAIETALSENGIIIPYPQREIRILRDDPQPKK